MHDLGVKFYSSCDRCGFLKEETDNWSCKKRNYLVFKKWKILSL